MKLHEMFFLLQLHVADLMDAVNYMHENKKYGKVWKLNLLLFVDVECQSHVDFNNSLFLKFFYLKTSYLELIVRMLVSPD